jgi:hypothetical protein
VNGASCGTLANLSVLVPTYLTAIPTDPTGTSSLLSFIPTAYAATTATGTGYKVGVNTAKQVLISAPLAELGVTVTVGNVPVVATADPTLVAHYLMNDNLSTTAVIDSKGNNGTSVRTTTLMSTTSGRIGRALSFNRTSDYVNLGNNFNFERTDPVTVSFWIKSTRVDQGFSDGAMILGKNIGTSHTGKGWAVFYYGGRIYFQLNGGTSACQSEIQVSGEIYNRANQAQWNNVIFTYNGNSFASGVKLYYNNMELNMTADCNSLSSSILNTGIATIGASSIPNSFFEGGLDDIRIYNRVLTSPEITQLYNGGEGTEAE